MSLLCSIQKTSKGRLMKGLINHEPDRRSSKRTAEDQAGDSHSSLLLLHNLELKR